MIIGTLEEVVLSLEASRNQMQVEGNKEAGRAISIAITHIETAILWLKK